MEIFYAAGTNNAADGSDRKTMNDRNWKKRMSGSTILPYLCKEMGHVSWRAQRRNPALRGMEITVLRVKSGELKGSCRTAIRHSQALPESVDFGERKRVELPVGKVDNLKLHFECPKIVDESGC